jgi:hypothetical protein
VLSLEQLLAERRATPDEALSLFDALPPVGMDEMIGRWRGFEISTGHPFDGLLEASGWYGKHYVGPNEVHPLVMRGDDKLFALDPARVPLWLAPHVPRGRWIGWCLRRLRLLFATKRYTARLELLPYRGRQTAAMIYRDKPIIDHFARLDAQRVLGLMQLAGVTSPYVFVLERDGENGFHSVGGLG